MSVMFGQLLKFSVCSAVSEERAATPVSVMLLQAKFSDCSDVSIESAATPVSGRVDSSILSTFHPLHNTGMALQSASENAPDRTTCDTEGGVLAMTRNRRDTRVSIVHACVSGTAYCTTHTKQSKGKLSSRDLPVRGGPSTGRARLVPRVLPFIGHCQAELSTMQGDVIQLHVHTFIINMCTRY